MERSNKKINTVMVVILAATVFSFSTKRSAGRFTPDASAQVTLTDEENGVSASTHSATWAEGDWNGDGVFDGERFEILSFRHGLIGQTDDGDPAFEDFIITKKVDKSSPKLAKAVAEDVIISKLEIETTATYGGLVEPLPYLRYELSDVVVTSYNIRGGGSTGNVPVEEVAFNFNEISVSYTVYDREGVSKGSIEFSWPAE